MGYYYDKDGITVRDSSMEDIEYLSKNMRECDEEEVWASNHLLPFEALYKGYYNSVFCCTVVNGNPIAMFGVVPESLLGMRASVWMLATDDLRKIRRRFVRHSKYFISMMLEQYPYLCNYVDNRNKESIEWLAFCGARIESAKPYGLDNRLFRYFYFKK